ncbi:hypothetical protein FIBSPDRAFT_871193 [Athelia psychrophila]|uniref:Uncharacterized protein n=1 Tax=Athelia psychrophila TaxID=1759441 RepID=A0A166AHW1_9AGAM|nr:hypothetical protein FIBSPDRAFT_871193 [Fibularhizoctonia sp. CBS 109695]
MRVRSIVYDIFCQRPPPSPHPASALATHRALPSQSTSTHPQFCYRHAYIHFSLSYLLTYFLLSFKRTQHQRTRKTNAGSSELHSRLHAPRSAMLLPRQHDHTSPTPMRPPAPIFSSD